MYEFNGLKIIMIYSNIIIGDHGFMDFFFYFETAV